MNFDTFEELKPDLIFTSTIVQDRIYKELQQKGFKVAHLDPRSLAGILLSIEAIGRLVQKEKQAYEIINLSISLHLNDII